MFGIFKKRTFQEPEHLNIAINEPEPFDLLILYKSPDKKIIKGVTHYQHWKESHMFVFIKNGHASFVPDNTVIFFGRLLDWEGEADE